ncbi:MAG TPA: DUF5916 domain-containing protein, partial [Longimicrobiaceae bacterium]|nr:DUF5916 domain-containing protein [Longimicrobiaceae bacterium]
MRCICLVRTLLLLFLFALPAHAQSANGPLYDDHSQAPSAVAVRAPAAPVIDGRLDDPAWQSAPVISGFYQMEPDEGEPVTQRTEVRILYDDYNLYVGAWMYDTGPISRRLGRRDSAWPDTDAFILFLDTYHDHRTAYRFTVNPSGTKRDETITGGGAGGGPGGGGGGRGPGGGGGGGGPGGGGPAGTGFGDTSWDPVWQVETSVDGEGWYAEMRIPFGQLRFRPSEQHSWGLQIDRRIGRRNEHASWAFTPRLERATVARFGHLDGISGIQRSGPIELLPFAVARAEYREIPLDGDVDFANPFRSGSDYYADAGLDLKYRVSSNYTLDATVNPDFGQVEIDPAEINLSAFETRFQERRPFFVDGAEIFQFGGGGGFGSPQILYTRRIGRSPQVPVSASAVYVDLPGNTTILGAAKLTGKTPSGWSLGILDAVTAREEAVFVGSDGVRRKSVAEPPTNYFVARARRDLNEGRTAFGLLTTAVNRRMGEEPAVLGRLPGAAYTGGIDFRHETSDRAWALSGDFSPSYVSGDPGAIVRLQRSSARYYHRPDADHVELDPTATDLRGYAGSLGLSKQSGAWRGNASFGTTSPGYEVNDIGFQTSADRLDLSVNGGYEEIRPGDVLRRWSIRSGGGSGWNYDGDRISTDINLFGNLQFLSYHGINARFGYSFESWDDRLTRGGPVTLSPAGVSGNINLNSDNRRALTVRGGMGFNRGDS